MSQQVSALALEAQELCNRVVLEAARCDPIDSTTESKLHEVVDALSEVLAAIARPPTPPPQPRRQVRLWMDGAFDMMHFGHVNAFRQGRALGTCLVVGVNSAASIAQCKGPPIMTDDERCAMVTSCKFVDEVVRDVPYVMDDDYITRIMQEHRIDYIVHGDDPCIVDGKDVYATAKARGMYRTFPRTEGVSTTDLVGRMLLVTRRSEITATTEEESTAALLNKSRAFLSTSRMMSNFASGNTRAPEVGATVVYVAGSWDLFHAGHAAFLKAARALGDYLVVGIHSDATVARRRGENNMPIMNTQERVLSVLGCGYVDDALIDAPLAVTTEMIESFKISIVARGAFAPSSAAPQEEDRFAVPKERGIFRVVESNSDLSAISIAERIRDRQDTLLDRYHRKQRTEEEYYNARHATNSPP